MASCAVKWCGKSSRTSNYQKDGITFYRFPKCPEMKAKWIDITFRGEEWFPNKNSVICSRHFTEDNFHMMKNRRRLMDSTLPTLNIPILTNIITTPCLVASIPENDENGTLLSTPKKSPTKKSRLETSPSAYDSPVKKRLCRRITELSNTVKSKNVLLRKLRDYNRMLKRKIITLKSRVAELENKEISINTENKLM